MGQWWTAIRGSRVRFPGVTKAHVSLLVILLVSTLCCRWYPAETARVATSRQLYSPALRTPEIRVRYFRGTARYSANWEACRQRGRFTMLSPLLLAGDVELNPGPRSGDPGGVDRTVRHRDSIRVMHQNVRSLRKKIADLRVNSMELELHDVIAFTETWLTDDVADAELQSGLKEHTWFRRDRPTHGGGVACAVRSSTSPARRHDLEPDGAELLMVELNTTPRVMLGVCYCPPADDGSLSRTMKVLRTVVPSLPRPLPARRWRFQRPRHQMGPVGLCVGQADHRAPVASCAKLSGDI